MRHKLLSIAQSIRLPSICLLCNQFHKNKLAVCDACMLFMPSLGSTCIHCAFPLPDTEYLICGFCIKKPPFFDSTTTAYRFEEPLRSLVHRFKYREGLYLAPVLSQLILNAWHRKPTQPQCLIPVPMHAEKLKTRGFNQAAVVTRLLAKRLQLPYDLNSCQKTVNTQPQALLDGSERAHNLRGAFSIKPLPYTHVALIDDLLTTGSTANELARTLKESGVERVELWCCARTVVHNDWAGE